jgi:hypothetical protein
MAGGTVTTSGNAARAASVNGQSAAKPFGLGEVFFLPDTAGCSSQTKRRWVILILPDTGGGVGVA